MRKTRLTRQKWFEANARAPKLRKGGPGVLAVTEGDPLLDWARDWLEDYFNEHQLGADRDHFGHRWVFFEVEPDWLPTLTRADDDTLLALGWTAAVLTWVERVAAAVDPANQCDDPGPVPFGWLRSSKAPLLLWSGEVETGEVLIDAVEQARLAGCPAWVVRQGTDDPAQAAAGAAEQLLALQWLVEHARRPKLEAVLEPVVRAHALAGPLWSGTGGGDERVSIGILPDGVLGFIEKVGTAVSPRVRADLMSEWLQRQARLTSAQCRRLVALAQRDDTLADVVVNRAVDHLDGDDWPSPVLLAVSDLCTWDGMHPDSPSWKLLLAAWEQASDEEAARAVLDRFNDAVGWDETDWPSDHNVGVFGISHILRDGEDALWLGDYVRVFDPLAHGLSGEPVDASPINLWDAGDDLARLAREYGRHRLADDLELIGYGSPSAEKQRERLRDRLGNPDIAFGALLTDEVPSLFTPEYCDLPGRINEVIDAADLGLGDNRWEALLLVASERWVDEYEVPSDPDERRSLFGRLESVLEDCPSDHWTAKAAACELFIDWLGPLDDDDEDEGDDEDLAEDDGDG